MVFSGLYFTFFFLPIVVVIYYLSKTEYRNYILLVASLYFYSYGEPQVVFVMCGSILVNYLIARDISILKEKGKIDRSKVMLIVDIIFNVGILFIYKYLDFSIGIVNSVVKTSLPLTKIALPIGISFFTFQAMSYVIDVYRGTVEVQKNPLYLALYISFFPQLVAGPIVRYSTIENQILERIHTKGKFADGVRRFFIGFCKKVIIANNLSVVATEVFERESYLTNPALLWIGSICFSLQIYFDFSGYSDMAIGLGKIFGFDFDENFNYPYISKSVTEFWRRWHISLGQWFRDYVYIPLGGSRKGIWRHIINMFVVWTLTGVWHGANYTFIAWGLGYFVLLTFEKYLLKPDKRSNKFIKIVWQIVTLMAVNFGWVIFNSSGIRAGIVYCLAMTGRYRIPFAMDGDVIRYLREYGVFIIAGVLLSTPILRSLGERINRSRLSNVVSIIEPVVLGMLFLWSVSYIVLGRIIHLFILIFSL